MTFIDAEIARQPTCWLRGATVGGSGGSGGSGGLGGAALPHAGERVAAVGCGTSAFMAEAYARLREDAGGGLTDHFAASEFPHARHYDRIVAITRSGTTTEIVDLLRRQRGRTATTVLTADAAAPAAGLADNVIALEFADELSIVQTLFATTALATLRAHLGHDVAALAAAARRVLDEPPREAWLRAEQVTFLGQGWAHGIAREAALKLREACQAWTEAYPTMEYRHGPISIAAPGRLVWQFGNGAAALGDEVARTGALFVDHDDDPLVDLIRVQRLSAAIAVRAGLDPDRPRHLSRSVVLRDPALGGTGP
jgi:fructoselysine-6-P-deglycase FrlB-like protein